MWTLHLISYQNSPVIPEKCDHFADVISLLFVFILRQHPGEKEKMLCPF